MFKLFARPMLATALALSLGLSISAQTAQSGTQTGSSTKPPAPKTQPAPEQATPVNLNTATAADLQKLPGIGPAVAERIIEQRQKLGGFKKVEDLMTVRGIGEKTFLKLKPLITVAPPKTTER